MSSPLLSKKFKGPSKVLKAICMQQALNSSVLFRVQWADEGVSVTQHQDADADSPFSVVANEVRLLMPQRVDIIV